MRRLTVAHGTRWQPNREGIFSSLGTTGAAPATTGAAAPREAPAAPPPDPCSGAEAHFKATESIDDALRRREALEDHVENFPQCRFARVAKLVLEELKARRPASVPRRRAGRNSTSSVRLHQETELSMPVLAYAPETPFSSANPRFRGGGMQLGNVYEFAPGYVYQLDPEPHATTTFKVLYGSVTLFIDGVKKLTCNAGNPFRVYTRGNASRFEVIVSSGAAVRVVAVKNGNRIRNQWW